MRAIPIDRFLDTEDVTAGAGAPDWKRLVAEGRAARAAADGGTWRIGALALTVERRYASGALKRFAEAIGESHGTVRRYRWVAGAYDAKDRARFPHLSFSHFQAVAGLPDRLVWLERAQHGGWSVDRLTITSRADGRTPTATEVKLRKPIESATRSLAKLTKANERELAKAARAGLLDAVDDLARQVEELRSALQAAANRRRGVKLVASNRSLARAR